MSYSGVSDSVPRAIGTDGAQKIAGFTSLVLLNKLGLCDKVRIRVRDYALHHCCCGWGTRIGSDVYSYVKDTKSFSRRYLQSYELDDRTWNSAKVALYKCWRAAFFQWWIYENPEKDITVGRLKVEREAL